MTEVSLRKWIAEVGGGYRDYQVALRQFRSTRTEDGAGSVAFPSAHRRRGEWVEAWQLKKSSPIMVDAGSVMDDEAMAEVLRGKGWTVEPPKGDGHSG